MKIIKEIYGQQCIKEPLEIYYVIFSEIIWGDDLTTMNDARNMRNDEFGDSEEPVSSRN